MATSTAGLVDAPAGRVDRAVAGIPRPIHTCRQGDVRVAVLGLKLDVLDRRHAGGDRVDVDRRLIDREAKSERLLLVDRKAETDTAAVDWDLNA
jgi:hypothetical protein